MHQKYRIDKNTYAYLEMNSVDKILKDKGLDPQGDAQMYHTQNCLRRIKKYMPKDTEMFIKTTIAQTNIRQPYIISDTPFAKYLFYGKVMRPIQKGYGPFMTDEGFRYRKGAILEPTDIPLKYDTTKNALAGPRWDQRLSAAEGDVLARDLENYMKLKGGR